MKYFRVAVAPQQAAVELKDRSVGVRWLLAGGPGKKKCVGKPLLTFCMALSWSALWPLWRLLAGMASALVFVYTPGWCLARLAAPSAPTLAGIIFVGPGLGITFSGLAASAMVAGGRSAANAWLVFGLLAAVLSALAWPPLRGAVAVTTPSRTPDQAEPRAAVALFKLAYGLAGFGCIVTATFLPVIARQALPGSVWLDLFWPLFGLGVAAGALLTVRMPMRRDRLPADGLLHDAGASVVLHAVRHLRKPMDLGLWLGANRRDTEWYREDLQRRHGAKDAVLCAGQRATLH